MARLPPGAALVTVGEFHPATLSWLGAVAGNTIVPLGVDRFGQSGDTPDLYRAYGIDTDAILEACLGSAGERRSASPSDDFVRSGFRLVISRQNGLGLRIASPLLIPAMSPSPLAHPPQQRGSIVGCRLTGQAQPRARDSVSQP